jgi:hypothetical protein
VRHACSSPARGRPRIACGIGARKPAVNQSRAVIGASPAANYSGAYWDIDTGFASLLMLLTAVDAGLGACFFGIPIERINAYRAALGDVAAGLGVRGIIQPRRG